MGGEGEGRLYHDTMVSEYQLSEILASHWDFFIDSENLRGSPTNALNLVKRGTVRARAAVTLAHKKWPAISI